jgi:hypothetical protein
VFVAMNGDRAAEFYGAQRGATKVGPKFDSLAMTAPGGGPTPDSGNRSHTLKTIRRTGWRRLVRLTDTRMAEVAGRTLRREQI